MILDVLEGEGGQESDTLDARVVTDTGLKASSVRNIRTDLANEGLVKPLPDKDEFGTILRWKVYRTGAPRS